MNGISFWDEHGPTTTRIQAKHLVGRLRAREGEGQTEGKNTECLVEHCGYVYIYYIKASTYKFHLGVMMVPCTYQIWFGFR